MAKGVSIAAWIVGFLCLLAGLLDLTSDGSDTVIFLLFGSAIGIPATFIYGSIRASQRLSNSDVLVGVTTTFLSCIALTMLLYLIIGATSDWDKALFEATAGFSTSALSSLELDGFNNGLLFFRGATQFLGALGALIVAIAILPYHGNGKEFADTSKRDGRRPIAPRKALAIRNITVIYFSLFFLFWTFLSLTELKIFDSLLLSMATVSTGGFTTSFNPFDNDSVQWILTGGMFLAGTSFVILWRLIIGKGRGIFKSRELRLYLLLYLISTCLIALSSGGFSFDSLRKSLFLASSSISTTGFSQRAFGEWSESLLLITLLLVAIGSMTASPSGGFQILRLRILFSVSVRELIRQLHPRAIVKIRIGKRVAKEETVRQVVVLQFIFLTIIFITAFSLAAVGQNPILALSASIHSLTTAGPIRLSNGEMIIISDLSALERLFLLPAMIFGRLYLLPVIISAGLLLAGVRNTLRFQQRFRKWKRVK